MVRQNLLYQSVEFRPVVPVDQMGQLVDHHVINGFLRIGYEPPGEAQPVFGTAGANRVLAPVMVIPAGFRSIRAA